ncbi:MAG: DNA polymerase III subunit beta [Verrucomicrobia bacterium]|nr:DNA polymerase III subunit beta [Verrucomicrobiota bacterium]
MKLILQKQKFLGALSAVQNVVSTRTPIGILNNLLLRASGSSLQISATDLDIGIRTSCEAGVEKAGAVTLPARRLFSIIRELPSEELTLDVDAKFGATIRCGAAFFRIMGMPEEEFPAIPEFPAKAGDKNPIYKIEQKGLKDLIKRVSYAMSADEKRYVLNGLLVCLKEGKLTLVATDGRRLALADQELEFPKSGEREFILPAKAVLELQRLLGDKDEVSFAVLENQILFQFGPTLISAKMVEGNYPNYRQVIPAQAKERVTLERELFLNSVRRVALLSSEKSNSVKLSFTKNNLEIAANTPDVGEAREAIPVQYKGKDFAMAFNPEFLADPLKNIDSDTVHFDFIDELSPGVIRYTKPFLYVIMPMRTA